MTVNVEATDVGAEPALRPDQPSCHPKGMRWRGWVVLSAACVWACGSDPEPTPDGGVEPGDLGSPDQETTDASDAGLDVGPDAGTNVDLGPLDPWEPPAQIDWAPCTESRLSGLECARLEVPLDHDEPRARIELAMARAPAEDQARRIGVILVNPGGPGGESRPMVRRVRDGNLTIRRRFDVIGVDWRGVGGSEPTLDCALDGELDELRRIHPFDEAAAHQAWIDRFRERCRENVGVEALAHIGVVDVAHDMDLVRRALGEEKLNFLGVSYGTMLGATFATLHPDSMRAFVLDAVVSPSLDPRAFMEIRTIAERDGLEDFFVECPRTPGCWTPGANAAEVESATMAFLSMADDGTIALPDRIMTAADAREAINYLMGPGLYISLGEVIRAALAGDPTLAFAVADLYNGRDEEGAYDGGRVANIAISCRDRYGPGAIAGTSLESSLRGAQQVDPRLGGWGFSDYRACVGWPAEAELQRIAAPTAPKMLLVVGEDDWWTPSVLGTEMRNALANESYLFESRGRGHGRWERPPAANRVRDYLLDPTRSPDETSCLRVPIERTVTATLSFDVPVRSSAGGPATIEVRDEANDQVLATVTTPAIGAGSTNTARLQVPSGGQPRGLYLVIQSAGHLTEVVRFNAPRRDATRVPVNLLTQSNLEANLSSLGLSYDPSEGQAFLRALDCEGPAGGVVIDTSTTAGRLVYSSLLDNRCVPDGALSNTDAICGSASWYAVPTGAYPLSYQLSGAQLQTRPLPIAAGVINHLVIDPAD